MKYLLSTKFNKPVIYIWITIVVLGLLFFSIKLFQGYKQRFLFIEKELHGRLIGIKSQGHDFARIKIVMINNVDTLNYSLPIEHFLEDNQIKIGDSISKLPDSKTVWFFKKSESGKYSDPIEYECPL